MRIIRTKAVELDTVPAIAYRQRIINVGPGITINRFDNGKVAVAAIDKGAGKPIMKDSIDAELFPFKAFEEAIRLTLDLPYTLKSTIRITKHTEKESEQVSDDTSEEDIAVVSSEAYSSIINAYTNDKGEFSHQLLNKDFIQFAAKSKVVDDMVSRMDLEEDILYYILISRISHLTENNEPVSLAQAKTIIDMLDDVSLRSAFKELNAHIRKLLARSRRLVSGRK